MLSLAIWKGGETLDFNLGHFENHPQSLHAAVKDGKEQVAAYLSQAQGKSFSQGH
jgi:hypothetical protein